MQGKHQARASTDALGKASVSDRSCSRKYAKSRSKEASHVEKVCKAPDVPEEPSSHVHDKSRMNRGEMEEAIDSETDRSHSQECTPKV